MLEGMLVCGVHWAARHEASSKYWGDTLLASTPGHCTHWPKGCVFREGFLGYLYSHFIYNPNSKTEKNKSHGGQVHVGHRERSTLGTSSLLKAGKVGLFSSQMLSPPPARAMQTNGETAQVRRPVSGQTLPLPVLWDRSE